MCVWRLRKQGGRCKIGGGHIANGGQRDYNTNWEHAHDFRQKELQINGCHIGSFMETFTWLAENKSQTEFNLDMEHAYVEDSLVHVVNVVDHASPVPSNGSGSVELYKARYKQTITSHNHGVSCNAHLFLFWDYVRSSMQQKYVNKHEKCLQALNQDHEFFALHDESTSGAAKNCISTSWIFHCSSHLCMADIDSLYTWSFSRCSSLR